ITNPRSGPAVAFFTRADVRRGTASGQPAGGDDQVLPVTWSDNDVALWPGQSLTLTATYRTADLRCAAPVVTLGGWNLAGAAMPAPVVRGSVLVPADVEDLGGAAG